MQTPKEVDFFLSEKRARKIANRRRRDWKEALVNAQHRKESDESFGRSSKIIHMLSDSYVSEGIEHRGHLSVQIPEVFSVIESPAAAIATISQFAKSIRQRRARTIRLDHSKLKKYDLAANGLLDIVAVELRKEDSVRRRKTQWSGSFPRDPANRRFIRALGIIKHLELTHEYPPPHEAAELRVFDVRNRHYYHTQNPNRTDFKSTVVKEFSDHINGCLNDHGRQLTPEARHMLCEYSGEILDNADQHAGMVDWSIQGYLDNSCSTPFCEIAIFNFGKTISETLEELPKSSYTWMQISPYLQMHRKRRLFRANWSERDLLTLIALQGHVSSKNTAATDTRGNGTVDLIEFFQKVYSECSPEAEVRPEMAILSGSTHIRFDGRYKLGASVNGSKIIAFNDKNDLNEAPDDKYVTGLGAFHFPGTVISIRFPLGGKSTVAKVIDNE
jgi:hypothetical protein